MKIFQKVRNWRNWILSVPRVSVCQEKKSPCLRQYQSYISNWYVNGKVFTSTTTWEPKFFFFFFKKFEIEFDLYFDLCWRTEIIQVGLNMHLYVDIGDASSSLWGSTSSFIISIILFFIIVLLFYSIIFYSVISITILLFLLFYFLLFYYFYYFIFYYFISIILLFFCYLAGVFGFCTLSILLIPFYWIPAGVFSGNPRGVLEDPIDAVIQLSNNGLLVVAVLGEKFVTLNKLNHDVKSFCMTS